MMTLRRTVHTLLGYPDPKDIPINPHRSRAIPIPQPDATGLRVLAGEIPKPLNVVASSAVGSSPKPIAWIDPGPDDDGGFGLCTECLGFESLDERVGGGDQGVEEIEKNEVGIGGEMARSRPRRAAEPTFPPPLASLGGKDGRRSSFLKAVRTDGRILLTEVTIERPEILRASRGDGRLRLHFIRRDREVEEEGVRWEWSRVRNEGVRCQEAVTGNEITQWWNHRYVATA